MLKLLVLYSFRVFLRAGENECSSDPAVYGAGTLPRCPENTWLVPMLLGGYILITNVLMLNLLIAMFRSVRDQ